MNVVVSKMQADTHVLVSMSLIFVGVKVSADFSRALQYKMLKSLKSV